MDFPSLVCSISIRSRSRFWASARPSSRVQILFPTSSPTRLICEAFICLFVLYSFLRAEGVILVPFLLVLAIVIWLPYFRNSVQIYMSMGIFTSGTFLHVFSGSSLGIAFKKNKKTFHNRVRNISLLLLLHPSGWW